MDLSPLRSADMIWRASGGEAAARVRPLLELRQNKDLAPKVWFYLGFGGCCETGLL